MNIKTARMLADIPEDLKVQGWRFVQSASRLSLLRPQACIAVYIRRYRPEQDDQSWADPSNYGFVRVTTDTSQPITWDAAREDAFAQMGRIDGAPLQQEPRL